MSQSHQVVTAAMACHGLITDSKSGIDQYFTNRFISDFPPLFCCDHEHQILKESSRRWFSYSMGHAAVATLGNYRTSRF